MLVRFNHTSPEDLRDALKSTFVNAVIFPEPQTLPRPFPYTPKTQIEGGKQFWMLGKEWKKNWDEIEIALSNQYPTTESSLSPHIMNLLDLFTEVSGDPSPFISLRTIDTEYLKQQGARSVSAGWHRDASVLTMQHTLTGEPLEYTPDENVNRSYFDQNQIQSFCDADELPLKDPLNYNQVPLGQVAILKGEMRRNEIDSDTKEFLDHFIDASKTPNYNVGRGLIHRGNKETENGRIILTVSTHKIPNWLM